MEVILPKDILAEIGSNLEISDLYSFMETCKSIFSSCKTNLIKKAAALDFITDYSCKFLKSEGFITDYMYKNSKLEDLPELSLLKRIENNHSNFLSLEDFWSTQTYKNMVLSEDIEEQIGENLDMSVVEFFGHRPTEDELISYTIDKEITKNNLIEYVYDRMSIAAESGECGEEDPDSNFMCGIFYDRNKERRKGGCEYRDYKISGLDTEKYVEIFGNFQYISSIDWMKLYTIYGIDDNTPRKLAIEIIIQEQNKHAKNLIKKGQWCLIRGFSYVSMLIQK